MTLSRWLRDYLYIPRGEPARETRTAINIMITMLLKACGTAPPGRSSPGGIPRHRPADRALAGPPKPGAGRSGDRLGLARQRFVTFNLVCVGWVLFRADSIGSAFELLASVFTPGTLTLVTPLVLLAIAASIGAQYLPRGPAIRLREGFSRLGPVVQGAALAVVLFLITHARTSPA